MMHGELIGAGTAGGGGDGEMVMVTDKVYRKAFEYYRICNVVLFAFALAKIIATPYYALANQTPHLTAFLIALFLVSVLQLTTCHFTNIATKDLKSYYQIAEVTSHALYLPKASPSYTVSGTHYRVSYIYDFTEDQMEEDERKMKLLSMDIKYHLHRSSHFLSHANQVNFMLYQVVYVWAILLLSFYEFPEKSLETYVLFVVVAGTYQYLQSYIFLAFLFVIMPVQAVRSLSASVKRKYKKFRLERNLKSQPFNGDMEGDQECKICLMTYHLNENVVVLQCSSLHHFHSDCFREWTKTASTCPLCRRDISTF